MRVERTVLRRGFSVVSIAAVRANRIRALLIPTNLDDASTMPIVKMKVHKGILLGFIVGLILVSLGFFLLQEKDAFLVMIKEFALWGGFAVVLGTSIVDIFMCWREFSS